MCAAFASAVFQLWHDRLSFLRPSFGLQTPVADRKRALGATTNWRGHRQEATAQKAQWAGYQLKRGAAKPLLDVEMEPGQAIAAALDVIHPFSVEAPLSPAENAALAALAQPTSVIIQHRKNLLRYWQQIALELAPTSIQAIRALPDLALRRLLLGVEDSATPSLG